MRSGFFTFPVIIILCLSIYAQAQVGPVILGPDGKPVPAPPPPAPTPISLEEAVQLLYANSKAIKIADKSVEIARAQKQKLNSLWYPYLTATGSYMHFSNEIEAKANAGETLKPLENAIKKHLPTQEDVNSFLQNSAPILQQFFPHLNPQEISGIISGIGGVLSGIGISVSNMVTELNSKTLSFPILHRNISTIDANLTWPLFTGGKRIFANKIGRSLIAGAEELKTGTTNAQLVVLIETYYTLKLSRAVVQEREESYNSMVLLFNNAMSLMRNGMINKAEMLVAQVAMEEAIRELENARESNSVAENALRTMIGLPINKNHKEFPDHSPLNPTTDFIILNTLPPLEYYRELIDHNNTQLHLIRQQQNIAQNEKRIAQSAYVPTIALFAKQTIYSYQIPSHLAPRTVIGAGFVWNLFDGLSREKSIAISRKIYEQLQLGEEEARNDLYILAHKLRSQMMDALYNIRALESTTELSKELLRIREKSFAEGMANSGDVVAARATLSKVRIASMLAYWQFDIALANMNAICGEPLPPYPYNSNK
ncbi:MAG: TolC family protein [Bacteroidales bacterium]